MKRCKNLSVVALVLIASAMQSACMGVPDADVADVG
jgi:hypothetical protein